MIWKEPPDLTICAVNPQHRYRGLRSSCPFCGWQKEEETKLTPFRDYIADHQVLTVDFPIDTRNGCLKDEIVLTMLNGDEVRIGFWAEYAESSGMTIYVNDQKYYG